MSTPRHPKGLYFIFATSTAERFSYYGMRAIFILFLTQALLFDKEHAASIYGSYTGLVYLTPLIGGYIADKYWGIRRSVFWGAMMMAVGQFLMFASASMLEARELSHWLMYGGLTFLILGNGCFKPTVSSLVGQLYEPGDKRLDSAYTIFYMGVNVGSFLAPLVCGYFGETGNPNDFRWGFLIAAIVTVLTVVLGWEMPASWVQSFNPLFVVILAAIMPGVWSALGKRGMEPASPTKQAIGLLLLSLGYLIICFGVKDVQPGIKVSLIWLTGLYFIHTMGEICLSPIGLSMVNKLTPIRFASLMMGIWYLSTATANKFAGILSGLYPEVGKVKTLLGYRIETMYDFFMVFVIMSATASLILFLLSKKLQKMMHGVE